MTVSRRWLGGVLNAGDEIGCMDTLWLLRVLNPMKFKQNPGITSSATVSGVAVHPQLTAWPGSRGP
jgi:hypothetical protein